MTDKPSDSGLHIDSDWKTEAAREKQKLAEQEAKDQSNATHPQNATFLELVNMIALQAGIALGGYQGPGGEKIPPNPHAAKHYVDLLEVIKTKTEGNLDDEEKKVLDAISHELRMMYVQSVNAPAPVTQPQQND